MSHLQDSLSRLERAVGRLETALGASDARRTASDGELGRMRTRCATLEARARDVSDRLDLTIDRMKALLEG